MLCSYIFHPVNDMCFDVFWIVLVILAVGTLGQFKDLRDEGRRFPKHVAGRVGHLFHPVSICCYVKI